MAYKETNGRIHETSKTYGNITERRGVPVGQKTDH
jgi:hypothetical protein